MASPETDRGTGSSTGVLSTSLDGREGECASSVVLSVVMVVVTVALGAVGTGLIGDEGERTGALVGGFITFGMLIWTSYTVMTER